MQKRHFLATFGTRTHSGGNDLPFNIFDNILGDTIASFMNDNDNAKCNSEMLRKIILENISTDLELSKRRIQAIAELAMGDGARVNVVIKMTSLSTPFKLFLNFLIKARYMSFREQN
uniref:Uncharacterized protein n=1 Tax=Meloidogyne enterolobii TaxID=390850 RepID=A0A6V7XE30_MELEN|nr:unnamed protein product [Meloidogyne enterolobii]